MTKNDSQGLCSNDNIAQRNLELKLENVKKYLLLPLVFCQSDENIFGAANDDTDWEIFDLPGPDGGGAESEGESDLGIGYDYKDALHKSYKFYYAQMSGKLPG